MLVLPGAKIRYLRRSFRHNDYPTSQHFFRDHYHMYYSFSCQLSVNGSTNISKIMGACISTNNTNVRKTLKQLGYGFNKEGQLRKIDSKNGRLIDQTFQYTISESNRVNRRNYKQLG